MQLLAGMTERKPNYMQALYNKQGEKLMKSKEIYIVEKETL